MLPERYHGLGLPNYVVHCLAVKVFFLWRHWGFDSAVGKMVAQEYEAFVMEVGMYGDVFTLDYEQYGCSRTCGSLPHI